MIYSKNNLVVKILFESFRKKPVFGIFRPQAYLPETGKYSSVCRFNIFKKPVEKGEQLVFSIIIEAPIGFGGHLKEGAVLTIAEGLNVIGKALVLEIIGWADDVEVN